MAEGNSREVEEVGKWVRGLRPKRRQLPLQHLSLSPESSTVPSLPLYVVEVTAGGAAVSSDGYGYNEKEQEEEERKKEGKIEGRKGRLKETKAKRQIQPDREVVSVYQEHTDLAASSLSVVVPSSSLLQHLPERHQAEQDPNPSTAPSQDHSLINLVLLQAQLSSSPFHIPYLFVFTPSHSPYSGTKITVTTYRAGARTA
ncbi:hypothetical protein EXN66_Car019145 [Channa argus]|uniref:Uncharacterized protein n=1 Tax=Channa argus TaxID=215402 RepID=A0A6G1QLW3_CHAAH|nr:hypothetical protein EXN66_Car019145 [Channa argus]